MRKIKTIKEKAMPELTPFVIKQMEGEADPFYYLEQYGNKTQIHKIEQTAKGVYITMWICRQDVRIFLSNREIEIEYYD